LFLKADLMAYRRGALALTAPSVPLFGVSAILAVLAALTHYGDVAIPVVSENTFNTLAIAFVILVVGVLMRRA